MAVKYFIRKEGRQQGPYLLEELPSAGVTPDTYVWSKGMDDWKRASQVADICRYYRRRLAGDLPQPEAPDDPEQLKDTPPDEEAEEGPLDFVQFRQQMDELHRRLNEEMAEYPPRVSMAVCILETILCFPLTGFIAIYYCWKATGLWRSAPRDKEGLEQRIRAHEYARTCRMWQGITFFLGLIVMAAVSRFL